MCAVMHACMYVCVSSLERPSKKKNANAPVVGVQHDDDDSPDKDAPGIIVGRKRQPKARDLGHSSQRGLP